MPLLPMAARPLFRPALFIATLLVFCAFQGGAEAQGVDSFSVRNVQEEIRDTSPNHARERALVDGPRAALKTLLQRLTGEADWARLPQPSDTDLQDLVLDVGIDQEKSSAVRYLATLSVRFKAEPIRRLLRDQNIAYAEWRGRPVMMVPLLQTDAGPVWDGGANPWRDLWKSGFAQGAVALAVPPQGDQAPPSPALVNGNAEALVALSQRLNSPDVAVAVAAPQKLDGNKLGLTVTVTAVGPVAAVLNGTRTYAGDSADTADSLMRRAIQDLVATVDEDWKRSNLLQYGQSSALVVEVPFSSFEEWLSIRDKLTRATPVRSYDVAALGQTEAALVLHYVGDQAQMESVFMQNGLVMTWLDDHWTLRTAAARPTVPK